MIVVDGRTDEEKLLELLAAGTEQEPRLQYLWDSCTAAFLGSSNFGGCLEFSGGVSEAGSVV